METLKEKFEDYHWKSVEFGDTGFPYIEEKAKHLSNSKKVWLCFMYSLCYSQATACALLEEYVKGNINDKWWEKNKSKLLFITNKRWVKSLNVFVKSVEMFEKIAGKGTAYKWFKTSFDKDGGFEMEKQLRELPQYGRISWFLFAEISEVVFGIKFKNNRLNMREAEKIKSSIELIYGKDMSYEEAEEKFNGLQRGMGDTVWSITSSLCAYFTNQKGGPRWYGYYAERSRKGYEFIKKNWGEDVYR